jgi:hypothetical protein
MPSYFGLCQRCGATGSWKQNHEEAVQAWNSRVDYWHGPDPSDMYTVLTDVIAQDPWGTEDVCWWCHHEQQLGHRADCAWLLATAVLGGFRLQR